ncbi:MAG: MFS transporter [Hyphomicrobiales bacterium]|nr:MFS transporter [Hyphomicrobiales bacterium]MDE2113464.1 MFS transporter [Hyphomicrobiales bacterium]
MNIHTTDVVGAAKPQNARLQPHEIRAIIIGLILAMLLAALDQTIVATAMPTIGLALHDMGNLSWVATAYLLTATTVTPLYGKFSDIHGRRITLLVGIVIFSIGSLLCALAPNMLTLILARGLQGMGGGGLIALSQTIIGDLVSPKERAKYQVYIASVFVLASIAGPLLGGFFAQHLHWTLIFWINLPLGLAAFLMTNNKLKRLPRHERPHRLDWLGAVLLIGATTTMLLGLSWGGSVYDWNSIQIILVTLLSAVLWASFVARLIQADEPLIPLSVLGNQVVATGMLSACFGMGTFIGMTIYMPIYMEGVLGLTASQSGLALIPLMVGTVTGATISGRVMTFAVHYKRLPLIGLAFSIFATLLLAFGSQNMGFAAFEALLAMLSIGIGSILPVSTIAIQNAVGLHELGTATASANFFRSLGGAISVAIFGTIVLSSSGLHNVDISTLSAPERQNLFVTFRYVYIAAGIGLGFALLFMAMMRELPLRGKISPAAMIVE